jgi:hypothetical protein
MHGTRRKRRSSSSSSRRTRVVLMTRQPDPHEAAADMFQRLESDDPSCVTLQFYLITGATV